MIKALVFDVDGVIVRPHRFRDWLQDKCGITPEMTKEFFTGPFMECARGRAELLDVLPPYLESWKWDGSLDDFVDAWLEVDSDVDGEMVVLTQSLRRTGFPCFVASTQERERAAYLADVMEFDTLFDGLFFSCDLGYEKPREEFYKSIMEGLSMSGPEILFFDDSKANVDAARALSWNAELFTDVDGFLRDIDRHLSPQVNAGRKREPKRYESI